MLVDLKDQSSLNAEERERYVLDFGLQYYIPDACEQEKGFVISMSNIIVYASCTTCINHKPTIHEKRGDGGVDKARYSMDSELCRQLANNAPLITSLNAVYISLSET
jgi:hypothetical protein